MWCVGGVCVWGVSVVFVVCLLCVCVWRVGGVCSWFVCGLGVVCSVCLCGVWRVCLRACVCVRVSVFER